MGLLFLLGTYYIQEESIREIRKEKNGTILSHRGFPAGQPYNRTLNSAIIRIKDLHTTVGTKAVVFVKFTSEFDIFANNAKTSCDDVLHIGNEKSQRWIDYCNNKKPPLDVWIPHATSTLNDTFFFWLVLSSELPASTKAVGFSLEYSGTRRQEIFLLLFNHFAGCRYSDCYAVHTV